MNLKEQLVDSSKIIGDIVTANVGSNPELYAEIMDMVLFDPMPLSSRAGRVLNLSTEKKPELFKPYIPKITGILVQGKEIHRCIWKIFAEIPFSYSKKQAGILVDSCFKLLADDSQPVSIKVYTMSVLERFAQIEPGIIPEFTNILEEILPLGTPGVKNRALKIMKKLKKCGKISL